MGGMTGRGFCSSQGTQKECDHQTKEQKEKEVRILFSFLLVSNGSPCLSLFFVRWETIVEKMFRFSY